MPLMTWAWPLTPCSQARRKRRSGPRGDGLRPAAERLPAVAAPVGHRPRNHSPYSNGPVKVEVPAPYVKTTERADPVSRQALLVEAWRWDQSALHGFLLSLQSGRGDLRGAVVSGRRRHQSSQRAWTRRSMSVVDRATGLLASPVVRRPVRERLAEARPTSIRTGRPSWRTDGSGHGLLAKSLGQVADLGFWVAAVAAEGLQKG